MAMTTTLIENAMATNIANPGDSQTVQNQRLAQAIIDTIKTADIVYTTGLANSGGAVTGVFGNTIS